MEPAFSFTIYESSLKEISAPKREKENLSLCEMTYWLNVMTTSYLCVQLYIHYFAHLNAGVDSESTHIRAPFGNLEIRPILKFILHNTSSIISFGNHPV